MTDPTTMTEPDPGTVDHALLGLAEIVLRGATSPHPVNAEAFGWQMVASRTAGMAAMAMTALAELAPETAARIARADAGRLGDGASPHAMARWVSERVLAPRGVDVDEAYTEAREAAEKAAGVAR